MDGIVFDSKSEMKRYADLILLQKHGLIRHLELQPKFPVYIDLQLYCTYTADFRYYDEQTHRWVVEDVKSAGTMNEVAFKLRKKAAELYHKIQVSIIIDGKELTKPPRGRKIKK